MLRPSLERFGDKLTDGDVALRLWAPKGSSTRVAVKFGSLLACRAFLKTAYRSPLLAPIAKELAVDMALDNYQVYEVVHMHGISNLMADALSRFYAPNPARD
eukprot:6476337-Amphidinium_carterae.5